MSDMNKTDKAEVVAIVLAMSKDLALAGTYADELGVLQAKISPLEKREKVLKAAIAAYCDGSGSLDGKLFHANVSTAHPEVMDKEAMFDKLKELMNASAFTKFIRKITDIGTRVTVKITAHVSSDKHAKLDAGEIAAEVGEVAA